MLRVRNRDRLVRHRHELLKEFGKDGDAAEDSQEIHLRGGSYLSILHSHWGGTKGGIQNTAEAPLHILKRS